MDDEPMLRDIMGKMLSRIGHEVDFAKDGAEAIELYKRAMESGQAFDAVILDLTNKSGMGGIEAVRKLREIDPDVKAVVATGYSCHPVLTNYRQYGFCGAIAKPFSMDKLYKTVEEVLTPHHQTID